MTSRFLTLDQVAEELGVTKWQAYTLVRRGDLRGMRIGGRHMWRVARDDLEAFITGLYEQTERWLHDHPLDDAPWDGDDQGDAAAG